MTALPEQIVDAMNAVHGVHPGFRAVHAKGSCTTGRFQATPEAAGLCKAAHLSADEIPTTVRFSSGSGKPKRADGARDERGMAVKLHLPNGTTTDMVGLTLPVFFVKTPEVFLEFLHAQRPDPATGRADLDRIGAFIDQHPETQKATMFVMMHESAASFAGCTFYGIHAFRITAPDGTQRFIRYQWVPEVPAATLTDEATRALGRNYLHEELADRLKSGSFAYELRFQIAMDDDDTTDPTTPWPEERESVAVGHLTIDEYSDDACDEMIFDPGRLVDGVERSEDPILHARSDAYSVSYARRTAARER